MRLPSPPHTHTHTHTPMCTHARAHLRKHHRRSHTTARHYSPRGITTMSILPIDHYKQVQSLLNADTRCPHNSRSAAGKRPAHAQITLKLTHSVGSNYWSVSKKDRGSLPLESYVTHRAPFLLKNKIYESSLVLFSSFCTIF
jgi:hypothetical protein